MSFIPSSRFSGHRPGFVFKKGDQGVGYYHDYTSACEVPRARDILPVQVAKLEGVSRLEEEQDEMKERAMDGDREEEDEEEESMPPSPPPGMSERRKRLFHLKLRSNRARKEIRDEVRAEARRLHGFGSIDDDGDEVSSNTRKRKKEWLQHIEAAGLTEENAYLLESAAHAQVQERYDQKKRARQKKSHYSSLSSEGLARAHEKRLRKAIQRKDIRKSSSDPSGTASTADVGQKPSDAAVERMVVELSRRREAGSAKSRRKRLEDNVDFVNEDNRAFNARLSKAFDKYTVETRQNLERGTAM
eukprot:g4299.t1